tara:strand:+ start:4802 stop:5074 length:273 start_codon:yes stop_codon:yes gene_type:complete
MVILVLDVFANAMMDTLEQTVGLLTIVSQLKMQLTLVQMVTSGALTMELQQEQLEIVGVTVKMVFLEITVRNVPLVADTYTMILLQPQHA